MGTHIPGVTAAVLIGIIFEIEAYWLPRDRQVTMRLYSVNDPPGRNPTPRSYRVNPEFYIHLIPRLPNGSHGRTRTFVCSDWPVASSANVSAISARSMVPECKASKSILPSLTYPIVISNSSWVYPRAAETVISLLSHSRGLMGASPIASPIKATLPPLRAKSTAD